MIGQVLGHCRIVAKIGEGGMGVVYRAYDEVLHREVAVKVVRKDPSLDSSGRQNLLQEARASSSLGHPNICTIHDIGEIEGELYIVMELVEGKSLHALAGETGLAPEAVLRYGVQLASALGRAHDRGIIHRDLKTANVVVTPEGLVKVLDFGLAKRVGGGILEAPTLSLSTVQGGSGVSGTLPYMAPEILRGDAADSRSDLWALGVVLYEAASGRLPFGGRTGFEISAAIMREIPTPLGPPVPPGLWAIMQRCLAKEPMQRYQRATEVQAALEAVQAAGIAFPEPSAPDRSGQPRATTLHSIKHVRVKKNDFVLLVGTIKGAFILRSNSQRRRWDIGGPYFHGQSVYALEYDSRGGQRRIWASTSTFWGTLLRSSDDFGKSWTNPEQAPIRFPADTSLKNIWQITLGPPDEPKRLYCGVEPAALFESQDGGETWSLVRGLFDHPHRPRWMPGNGGLALHTVLLDPSNKRRMYVAISSGGVYRTLDGGQTWTAQNRGIRALFMPEKYPEFGQCVHKIALHAERPERLFLQNHRGLYRSDDYGEHWIDIANGVPSDFGFPVVVHPRNPNCVYAVPVESEEFRCACDGRLRIYRTRNAGGSWQPLMRGLPQKRAYETVLRDAMITDSLDPVGIYFGTRSGQLFGSNDEGKNWKRILGGLPGILCVRCGIVEEDGLANVAPAMSRPSPASTKKLSPSTLRSARKAKKR